MVDFTEYIACLFLLLIIMFPTPKNDFIRFNNNTSLPWTSIAKIGFTLHPNARSLLLVIEIINEDSASANPVTQKGFKELMTSRELDEFLTDTEWKLWVLEGNFKSEDQF